MTKKRSRNDSNEQEKIFDVAEEICNNEIEIDGITQPSGICSQTYNPVDPMLRSESIVTNKTSPADDSRSEISQFSASIKDIEEVDDLLIRVFQFFFSEPSFVTASERRASHSRFVDGNTLRNAMLVSERWYDVLSSTTLWCDDICHNLSKSRDAENGHYYSNITKFATELIDTNGKTSDFDEIGQFSILQRKLVGYANLGLQHCNNDGVCFKVRERATGRSYFMRINRMVSNSVENTQVENQRQAMSSKSPHLLREASVVHKVNCSRNQNIIHKSDDGVDGNMVEHPLSFLNLPLKIEASKNATIYVRCYEFIGLNMEECFDQIRLHKLPPFDECIATEILRQLLQILYYIHSRGIIHRNLKPKHILLHLKRDHSGNVLSKNPYTGLKVCLSNFSSVLVHAYPNYQCASNNNSLHIGDHEKSNKILDAYAADMKSFGFIFAKIILSNESFFSDKLHVNEMLEILHAAGSSFEECGIIGYKVVPFSISDSCCSSKPEEQCKSDMPLCKNDGVLDLLRKLLNTEPRKRIVAYHALCYPFLKTNLKSTRIDVNSLEEYGPITGQVNLMKYLKMIEKKTCFDIPRKHIRQDQWATLVDWLLEIVDVFKLNNRAAFVAMNYFDRFIASNETKYTLTGNYQLLAATCLHIASKCEEGMIIGVHDLVLSADNTYTVKDIISLEELVLRVLRWQVSSPVVLDFATLHHDLSDDVNMSSSAYWMSKYLAEIALQSNVYLSFKPSVVSASVIILALYCTDHQNVWTQNSFETISNCCANDLKRCAATLWASKEYVRTMLPKLKMIHKRFGKSETFRVSHLAVPATLNLDLSTM